MGKCVFNCLKGYFGATNWCFGVVCAHFRATKCVLVLFSVGMLGTCGLGDVMVVLGWIDDGHD